MLWNRVVTLSCIVAVLVIATAGFPDGLVAMLTVTILAAPILIVFRRYTEHKDFITNIFLFALAVRLIFGAAVHVLDLRDFFGPDAFAYDANGKMLADIWLGRTEIFISTGGASDL